MSLGRVQYSSKCRVVGALSSSGNMMSLWLESCPRRSLLAGIELFEKIISFSVINNSTQKLDVGKSEISALQRYV